MYYKAAPPGPAGKVLVSAALEIAQLHGVAGISARSLADKAGVSASSVNYHFGSLEQLLQSVSVEADALRAAYWGQLLDSLETLSPSAFDFVPFVFSAIRSAITDHSGAEAVFWNDVLRAARTDQVCDCKLGIQEEGRFWQSLLAKCGLENVNAHVLHSFALALRFGYLIYRSPAQFDPWALALITQFGARAMGKGQPTDSAVRARAELALAGMQTQERPGHPTADSILSATVEILLREGAEIVTHRSVAKRAEISVSSVQHFFGTRSALLEAAYQEVLRQTLEKKLPEPPKPGTLSSDEIFSADKERKQTSIHREFAAIQGVMLSVSFDPQASNIAQGMLARAGANSENVLRALRKPRGPFGRLDGQIFSLTMSHLRALEVSSGAEPGGLDRIVGLNMLTEFFEAGA